MKRLRLSRQMNESTKTRWKDGVPAPPQGAELRVGLKEGVLRKFEMMVWRGEGASAAQRPQAPRAGDQSPVRARAGLASRRGAASSRCGIHRLLHVAAHVSLSLFFCRCGSAGLAGCPPRARASRLEAQMPAYGRTPLWRGGYHVKDTAGGDWRRRAVLLAPCACSDC